MWPNVHAQRSFYRFGHPATLRLLKRKNRLWTGKIQYVRPYSKGQKNDLRDAEAIAEAVQRPTMKFV